MTHDEAVDFLKNGVEPKQGVWLDLGAGSGVFSKALAELLPSESTVYAVDKEALVLNISSSRNKIISLKSDFENLPELPKFDGIIMANALHYLALPVPFLQNLLKSLRPSGSFLMIEYDMEEANPWVPFPIPFQKWTKICSEVGLTKPVIFNERISLYRRGTIYAAISKLEY